MGSTIDYILTYNETVPIVVAQIPKDTEFREWGDSVVIRKIAIGFIISTPPTEDHAAVFHKGLARLVGYGASIFEGLDLTQVHQKGKVFVENPTEWEKKCYATVIASLRQL